MRQEEWVGVVTHYYPRAKAAAVRLDLGELHVGDEVHIEAPGVDIRKRIKSMELDHEPIKGGRAGQEVGIGLEEPVPENANVFVIREE